ncbi:uncharacterized protein PgNI_02597 [Pyricularia grisea]|uniref:Uncharacterized protein n=1 Tax=Pyricularia grisea TaxID=148305 RepID=A0A6P8BH09_PYRGI|nr:uncharacterized protein PgNI_02597 [Pyricularia grisea]TLD16063.1 hypothetical protein PgNI_02597 [Pyricularia grisea]
MEGRVCRSVIHMLPLGWHCQGASIGCVPIGLHIFYRSNIWLEIVCKDNQQVGLIAKPLYHKNGFHCIRRVLLSASMLAL